MKKEAISLIITLFLIISNGIAQSQFAYKRALNGINEPGWYQLQVPEELYSSIQEDLSDLRILSITDGDTVEAPYIIDITTPIFRMLNKDHEIINQSKKNKKYFYTLEMENLESINEIELELSQRNFSWKVTLEGSNDQSDWFTILNRFRIIGISNSQTDYKYTRLRFPDSKYKFYRIAMKSDSRPRLKSASSRLYSKTEGSLKDRKVLKKQIKEVEGGRFSIVNIKTASVAPVSEIEIQVSDTFDYYRPLQIQRLIDSIQYETGWQKRYETIYSGTLSSFNRDAFTFSHCIANEFKVEITNYDNEPINIENVTVKGPTSNLKFRISEPGNYSLFYSNSYSSGPLYDIEQFIDKIPSEPENVTIDEEVVIPKPSTPEISALFENKLWLWLIMGAIIIVLGLFSINMLKKA